MTGEQSAFWSKVAQKYDRVVDLQLGAETRAMERDRIDEEGPLGRLAEFGCGTGFYTQVLAERAQSVVATDIAPGILAQAKARNTAANITFQQEDCQKTSFADGTFDTVLLSLVIHFTQPARTLVEMRRILKPGGLLVICNLGLRALSGLDRLRSQGRILFHGSLRYRVKPPKGLGKSLMTEQEICDLLGRAGFKFVSAETFKDRSRPSSIPIEYIKAVRA